MWQKLFDVLRSIEASERQFLECYLNLSSFGEVDPSTLTLRSSKRELIGENIFLKKFVELLL